MPCAFYREKKQQHLVGPLLPHSPSPHQPGTSSSFFPLKLIDDTDARATEVLLRLKRLQRFLVPRQPRKQARHCTAQASKHGTAAAQSWRRPCCLFRVGKTPTCRTGTHLSTQCEGITPQSEEVCIKTQPANIQHLVFDWSKGGIGGDVRVNCAFLHSWPTSAQCRPHLKFNCNRYVQSTPLFLLLSSFVLAN